jgi:hypothetical protein
MTVPPPTGSAAKWDAIKIAPADHVAVAVRDLVGSINVLTGGELIQCVVPSLIPMGHKFALFDMPAGSEIRKYGQVIGMLTRPVNAGEHVHIHNLASLRARLR